MHEITLVENMLGALHNSKSYISLTSWFGNISAETRYVDEIQKLTISNGIPFINLVISKRGK